MIDLTPGRFDPSTARNARVVSTSPDGKIAYLQTGARLAPDASTGRPSLYLWREGEGLSLIGTFDEIGPSDFGYRQFDELYAHRQSANGRYFAFATYSRMTSDDTANQACPPITTALGTFKGLCTSVYVYDAEDESLVCASCSPSGERPTGHTSLGTAEPLLSAYRARVVTDDGRLFFTSPDRLVPEDSDGKLDVYQWDDGQLDLLSVGTATDSTFADVSPDGDDVFFATADQLVGQDRDDNVDIYDARVGGGLPDQGGPAPSSECAGDACRPPQSSPPGLRDPAPAADRPAPAVRPRPKLSKVRLSRAAIARLAEGARVPVRVRVNRGGVVKATVTASLGGKRTVVASASRRAAKAGRVTLRLRLSKAARQAVGRRKRLAANLTLRFSPLREAQTLRLTFERGEGR